MRLFWQPVCEAERLKPGRALPLRIMSEDLAVYRGQSGTPYLVEARCAHRGAHLSVGRVEGETLACLYHGWAYDGSGQCVAQPPEPRSFASTVRIRSFPAREYLGLIFAYLGIGEPPPFPRILAAEGGGLLEARVSRRAFPFFSQLENSVDEVHFNFTHRASTFTAVGLNDHIPEVDCEETDYGIVRYGKRPEGMRISHILMPNCLYAKVHDELMGWTEHLSWRVPIDDASHFTMIAKKSYLVGEEAADYERKRAEARQVLAKLEPADKVVDRILSGELHLDDVPHRPDIVTIQDAVVLRSQGTWPAREKDQLGASDRQVRMLRQIYARELAALAEGKPTKAWRIPPELATSTGLSS